MFSNPVAAAISITMISIGFLSILLFIVNHYRFVIWSGYMRLVFTGEDRNTQTVIRRVLDSDHDFEITHFGNVHKYSIDRNRIYRVGRFRIPTAYYKVGDAEPLDMLKTGEESEVSSLDYAKVARNTVTRDLLASFEAKFLSAQNIFIITLIVIVGAVVLLGVFVNQKFGELEKLHQPTVTNTGSPPNTGGDFTITE